MVKQKKGPLLLLWFGLFADVAWGHVSLTFPPARQLPLDFLNTFWTKQPCGMPRGGIGTTLVAGESFNATWHLGYAHQGGYSIELLNQNELKIADLTPTNDNSFVQGSTTAQSHLISIPSNSTCRGCIIRLLRQVPEFAPKFKFISCADVDIVPRQSSHVERCSGHGQVIGGRCTCYARYWGDHCQFQDECDTDLDCNQGRCLHLGGSALPRKQCFCPETHFGTRCGHRNPASLPKPSNFDLSKHIRVKLDERVVMYFKLFISQSQSQDEVEFVIQMNGTSYGGLGWRPEHISPACKSWPFHPNALQARLPASKRQKRASTFTITRSVDLSEQTSPRLGGGRSSQYNHVFSASSTKSVVQSPVYQTFSTGSAQLQNNNVRVVELTSTPTRTRVSHETALVHNFPSVVEARRTQQSVSVPQQQLRPQQSLPIQSGGASASVGFSSSEWAAKDPFTPMDCSDIVTGSARGRYHRIRDSFARGRHTPLPDSVWGGRDDLLGAAGWEVDGVTTLVFRRRAEASDGPDHSVRGDMQVIWARGQEPGEFVPNPSHQLVPGDPTVSPFYTRDELKYHGLGSQRGFLFIDFDAVRQEYVNGRFSN